MSLTKEAAFDIFGLPTFASTDEIKLRYKFLSLVWFPENYTHSEFAIQQFRSLTLAAIKLLSPDKATPTNLLEMYAFFQHIFFGHYGDDKSTEYDYDYDQYSESSLLYEDALEQVLRAEDNASELIDEEEREKAKVEKRRAKKKRRKERKKLEKVEKTIPEKINNEPQHSAVASSSKSPTHKNPNIIHTSVVDEEICDMSSAFMSVLAKKHSKLTNTVTPINEINDSPLTSSQLKEEKEKPRLPRRDDDVKVATEIATSGNQMANAGSFADAVRLFSASIALHPTDHRFYNNRSFCYERMGEYEKALADANTAISLDSTLPKGYFRKGRAYLGLKKYTFAELAFVEVLKRDCDSEDAKDELYKSKVLQLMEKGYSKAHSESAISRCGTVSKAHGSLMAMSVPLTNLQQEDIFMSDDESEASGVSFTQVKVPEAYDIKKDPRNPEQHNSLWIGNVQPDVTEKQVKTMFAKYGELISVKVMNEKFCAFVNYKSKASAGPAMKALQGKEVSGYNLLIRFPNLPGDAPIKKPVNGTGPKTAVEAGAKTVAAPVTKTGCKIKEPVNGNECYFWRTTGCMHGNACHYEHIMANKGIDKKAWM